MSTEVTNPRQLGGRVYTVGVSKDTGRYEDGARAAAHARARSLTGYSSPRYEDTGGLARTAHTPLFYGISRRQP